MNTSKSNLGIVEFISLMALITSLIALSIDSILPALSAIGSEFEVGDPSDTQKIIIYLFLGLSFGQFFYGPLADSIGRKPSIMIGIIIFLIGSLVSIYSDDLNTMLFGRFLQGLGVASPRIVTMAIVRDCYSGRDMARIMSFMMTLFILVPIIAPTLGYWILLVSEWRAIFIFNAVLSILALVWFFIRQHETLNPQFKQAFNIQSIVSNMKQIFMFRSVIGFTVMSGLIFGAFLGYLSASQHIFQVVYDTGNDFTYYFAALASSLGLASFLNAKWVLIISPYKITRLALILTIVLNALVLIAVYLINFQLTLFYAMLYLAILFFLVGLLFGNLNALSMEPIGHLAGVGAGIVGALSTFISVPLGSIIGQSIETDLHHFVLGFFFCSLTSFVIILFIQETE